MNMDQDRQMLMVEDNNGLSVDLRIANQYGIGNVITTRSDGNGNGINGNEIRCYNYQGVDHYARNCTVKPRKKDVAYLKTQLQIAQNLKDNLQQAVTSGTQTNNAPAYDSDGSAK
ncbi:hypothetical protein Tco_0542165, partial [Tanacetum coccineum]